MTKGFRPKSNTTKAKGIIRSEIRGCGWNAQRLKSQIDSFRSYDRNVFNGYSGGKKLVEDGSFACYYDQTDDMLNKIYGKKNVDKWSNEKKWNTYKHLISREIDSIYNTGKMSLKHKRSCLTGEEKVCSMGKNIDNKR